MKATKIKLYRDLGTMLSIIVLLSIFLFQNDSFTSLKSILLIIAIAVPLVNLGVIIYQLLKVKKGQEVKW